MKRLIYLFVALMISQNVLAQRPFITRWKTDNAGTSNSTSITIPTTGTGYSYDVDWNNDGTFDDIGVTGNITHSYGTAGTYTVAIRGAFPRIYFNYSGDKLKLLSIERWGEIAWTSMAGAFSGCANMVLNATDVPNTIAVRDMSKMFAGCSVYNQALPDSFNTSKVTNMLGMFAFCISYNQALPSSFNTSNVTNMSNMFNGCSVFNQALPDSFNTSKVTDMSYMFQGCSAYNQALPDSFNTSKVTNMSAMFAGCTAFNQNIGGLNITDATNMLNIFNNSGISQTNYDAILIAWDAAGYTNKNLGDASPLTYCAGQAARTNMINTKGWTITGDVFVVPTLTLGTIPAICSGATSFSIPYTASTGTPTTYTISGTGITAVMDGALPSVSITVSLSAAASGISIPFTLTVKNASGCVSANITGSVTVNALPTVTAGAATNPSLCGGTDGSIAFTTNLANGAYTLNYKKGLVSLSSSINVSANTFILSGLMQGSYSEFSINNAGCIGMDATNRDLTEPPSPTVSISANPGNFIASGAIVAFTATPTNGGSSPFYQWKKNGNNVGTNSNQYIDAALNSNDQVWCLMSSNDVCAFPITATSNVMTINACPTAVNWTNQTVTTNQWLSVAYGTVAGNGLFVAVGNTGANRVMTSPDGVNWTARTAVSLNTWQSVTYGNGLFVAVARDSTYRVMTSPDGINWTARIAAAANDWQSVTYGNGLFVAVARNSTNQAMTSPDGINWTTRVVPSTNEWWSVTYGNGLFVAVARNGSNQVMSSPDGINWTARTAAAANEWQSVSYGTVAGNPLFVAVSSTGSNRVMTSPDGINWTSQATPTTNQWRSVAYGIGLYVAVADDGANRVMTSPDGMNWTSQLATQQSPWLSVTYGNGLFVAVAPDGTKRVMTSGFKIQLPITTDITTGSVSYTAGTIIASNQVTNSNVTYTASQSVMLLPGFKAESTVFKAQIAGCPN